MAIVYQSGSVYADTTGQLVTGRAKIAYIIFSPNSNGDEFTLRDGTSGSDPVKITVASTSSTSPTVINLSDKPMVFISGIYLSSISLSCHLTIVLTNEGANI